MSTKTAQRARVLKAANDDMRQIDWAAVNRLARECRAHLDTLSPERRAELQQEWNND